MTGFKVNKEKGIKKNRSTKFPVILFILAIIYDILPIDLIPDIPVIGWIDDLVITLTAGINLIEKAALNQYTTLQKIVRIIKWSIFIVGVIVIILLALSAYGVFRLIAD